MAEPQKLLAPGRPGIVSVIMPAFNAARWLNEAINSVLMQDWHAVELIVADDGSTDGTAEIAAAYGSQVRLLRLPHRGVTAARNAALLVSTGEFIAFLDADDCFAPGHLHTAVAALQQNPAAGMSVASVHFVDTGGNLFGMDRVPVGSKHGFLTLQFERNRVYTCAAVARRVALQTTGLFDPEIGNHVEDYDLWVRIGARFPVVWVDEFTTLVRRHPDSASTGSGTLAMLEGERNVVRRIAAMRPSLRWRLPERYARNYLSVAKYWMERGHLLRTAAYASLSLLVCPWRPLLPQFWRDLASEARERWGKST